jgi:oligopeptide transport system substrate-binding protein
MVKAPRILLSIITVLLVAASALLSSACSSGGPSNLRVNLGGNPGTLDPQKTQTARDLSVIVQIFDGLIGYNEDLTLKPVVAVEVPTVANDGISADGLVYTFTLRQDVTWSDGEPVTADNFVYALERLVTYDVRAPYRGVYYGIIENALAYLLATRDGTELPVLGAVAVDDYTLEITLNEATPSFLQRMALWAVYPLREDIITANEDDWAESPTTYIGNGPFVLKEWVDDDHITLERNSNYWGEPAKLEGIEYAMYEDAATEYLAFLSGDLDITKIPTGTEKTVADDANLVSYSRLKTNALFFDIGEEGSPFANAELRKAFSLAIDRNALVDDLQGGKGSVSYCWVPAGMPGYDASYQQTCGDEYAFDATAAKAKLTAAGYASGEDVPSITMIYSNVSSNPTIAQFIQGQLSANLGVSIDVVGVGSAAYWDRVFDAHDSWDMAYISFSADYADPDNWLPDSFASDGGYNGVIAQYNSTAYDAKVAEALAETSATQRLDLWQDAEELMVADAPAVFLFNDEMFVLKSDRVEGITGTPMDLYVPGDMFLDEVYLK